MLFALILAAMMAAQVVQEHVGNCQLELVHASVNIIRKYTLVYANDVLVMQKKHL